MSKPITLYGHATGPNPWKVAIVLEELKIPYELKMMEMSDLKQPPYEKINVNGRVPAIEDPNTGITLWESGAIIEYLVETYDTNKTFHYSSSPDKFLVSQWLHFQMSGQGPYFGQAAWFYHFHSEKIQSAKDRYKGQVTRVFEVLNKQLKGRQYLVGDKCTIADLAFVPWDMIIPWVLGDEFAALDVEKNYPEYYAWNQRLQSRPAVQKIIKDRQAAMASH